MNLTHPVAFLHLKNNKVSTAQLMCISYKLRNTQLYLSAVSKT
jgi:hypothetical protein